MAKQKILPFFIPMEGCAYQCIYCDQVAISGQDSSPDAREVTAALAAFDGGKDAEVAFYGGSFTCLPEEKQRYYFGAAKEALSQGIIGGIRISTRPDAINDRVCAFLAAQGVRTVELGIQSFDDEVLAAAGRGYGQAAAQAACRSVVKAGLRLGVQLMTGLPQDTAEKSQQAVRIAAELGAKLLRIYPTLVLQNTPLAKLYQAGQYQPQTIDEAVACCSGVLREAMARGLTIIRIGINPSESVKAALVAGPYHEAFGGLIKEALTFAHIEDLLSGYQAEALGQLLFAADDMPLVFGHHKQGMMKIAAQYPNLALMPSLELAAGELRLIVGSEKKTSQLQEFCLKSIC